MTGLAAGTLITGAAGVLCSVGMIIGASGLLLIRTRPRKLPVLNYHSVSADPAWLQLGPLVSLDPVSFDRQLAWLHRHEYETLFISEAHALLTTERAWPSRKRYVALTFDDGFADNWIAVYPLLKRYDMKATLFISADFIDPRDTCRPTCDDTAEPATLDWSGYCSWPELSTMQASGHVEIQAHGSAHTRVFSDDRLQGFVTPTRPNLWLHWDAFPEQRTCWWRSLASEPRLWGHPVFGQRPALTHRAYRPDPGAVQAMLAWTHAQGAAFFEHDDAESRLRAQWSRLSAERRGTWEDDTAYPQRVTTDLTQARETLEAKLEQPVRYLCWPENRSTPDSEALAREAGYIATLPARRETLNIPGRDPSGIARVYIGSGFLGQASPTGDLIGFVLQLKIFEGWYILYPGFLLGQLICRLRKRATKGNTCGNNYWSTWA